MLVEEAAVAGVAEEELVVYFQEVLPI
jgi:hypothetical protein